MRPTSILRSGGDGEIGKYLGGWGNLALGTHESSESQTGGGEGEAGGMASIESECTIYIIRDQATSRLIVGYTGSQPQKGVASYALSANRQRPLAGALNAAIFNTWRRFRGQVLYVAPPFIIAYTAMQWAIERFVLCLAIQAKRRSN
ncbi:hypothetical protein DSL72_002920 [Monilinia vaccinii-corymbosi]|uniref:Cytochrome b-c1 complex subunit 8 n=1 Tax=Monilinia vaccinii-corymbosi TaxID=61207 RepID=A0A8A3PDR2_9HELO|nr:hypothetical protein DSL72_002920 [Monilinia vaccinii-corymbosi]